MKLLLLAFVLIVPLALQWVLTRQKRGQACPTGCKGCGRCFKKDRKD